MSEPTPDQLEALLRVQDADTHLRQIDHKLANLPEQASLDALAGRARTIDEAAAAERVEADLAGSEVRRLEGDLSLLTTRREAEQLKLYGGEITNQRELQGLEKEIESVGRRIGDAEEALLEAMERSEEIDGRLADLAQQRDALSTEREQLEAARDAAAKELLAERAEVEVQREKEAAAVPSDVLERYDAKRAKAGGLGVGLLEGGACTACHMALPRADVNEIRAEGEPLTTCPQCQRLLVVRL